MTKNAAIGTATGSIWLSVALISVLSPDMVSGSEHEHLPLAGMTAWLWGLVASGYLVQLALVRVDPQSEGASWQSLALAVGAIWLAATVASVFGPRLITGSDPTEIPLAALIAPPVATVATAFVCLITLALAGQGRRNELLESPARLDAVR